MAEFELESLITARRLAQTCPTSFSIDDLNITLRSTKKNNRNQNTPSRHYIPPSPSITLAEVKEEKSDTPIKKSRFSCLFDDLKPKKAEPKKSQGSMVYSLPNVTKIATPNKANRQLFIVNLSTEMPPNPEPIVSFAKQLTSDVFTDSDSD